MKRKLLSLLESFFLIVKRSNKYPPIFVIGCPRSGTTIISQYLLAKYKLGYFSNVDRKNKKHPIISALWNQSAKKFAPQFRNKYGHIKGKHAPGDGWEIFHRWFSYYYNPNKTKASIHQLKTIIACYESIYKSPFFVKNNANSLRISELISLFPDAIFIVVKRDIYENTRSILKGKKENAVPDGKFWSTGPDIELVPNIPKKPIANIVYQYLFVNKFIVSSIKKMQHKKVITIDFTTFKNNPDDFLDKFAALYDGPLILREPIKSKDIIKHQKILDSSSQVSDYLRRQINHYILKYESDLENLIEYLLTTHNSPYLTPKI